MTNILHEILYNAVEKAEVKRDKELRNFVNDLNLGQDCSEFFAS